MNFDPVHDDPDYGAMEDVEDGMAKQSPTFKDFNPTNDERVAKIKGRTDELIELVRHFTQASGPQTQRRAEQAAMAYEEASMWAVKALFSEDAIRGDDGGGEGAGSVGKSQQ